MHTLWLILGSQAAHGAEEIATRPDELDEEVGTTSAGTTDDPHAVDPSGIDVNEHGRVVYGQPTSGMGDLVENAVMRLDAGTVADLNGYGELRSDTPFGQVADGGERDGAGVAGCDQGIGIRTSQGMTPKQAGEFSMAPEMGPCFEEALSEPWKYGLAWRRRRRSGQW